LMISQKMNNEKKVIVISGASSGIGFATAKYLSQNGFIVYGLARRIFNEKGINSISCDVTNKERVREVIKEIFDKEKRIDVLINNAGMGISGSSEFQDLKDIEKIFNVNFIGAVNLSQEVLPIMRKQKFGKIINTSSVAGIIPIPFQSFYSATKASLDIWAKALSLEVTPFNVQICNLLVGDTKTNFTSVREKNNIDKDTAYAEIVEKSIKKMEKDEQNGKDPITVAKVVLKLCNKKKMPITKVVGITYKILLFLEKILPQKFMMFVVKKLYA